MGISFTQKGDFSVLTKYLTSHKDGVKIANLDKYGAAGVRALASATPVNTGATASSWYYNIINQNGKIEIQFCNSNQNKGVPIAIILQYGHATGSGGWVEGRDYINPALRPIFDNLADAAWKEVSK